MATHGPGGAQSRMTGPATGTAGPHQNNLLNKLDPRVDSDADGSRNMGAAEYGAGANRTGGGLTGNSNTHGNSLTGNNAGVGHHNQHAHGHNAGLQDSYNTNSEFGGAGNPRSGNVGPHDSNLLNKLDPRVDSDADGARNMGMANYGPGGANSANTGPATGTAGHHNSNMLNKLDPTVNSDATGYNNTASGGRY